MQIVELPSFSETAGLLSQPVINNGLMAPMINGNQQIKGGTIFADQLVIGSQAWVHTIAWTPTTYQKVSWSSGTLTFANGNSYSIASGDTGNFSGTLYIFFDSDVSQTVLQTTATFSATIGNNRILLATVASSASTGLAIISPVYMPGTTISGNKIVTGKIQSSDGRTYFDLDNSQLVTSDGTNPRGVFGTV